MGAVVSEEVAQADAAVTALHEAQQEVQRLTSENDRLLRECEAAESVCGLARAAAAASLFPGRGPLVGALAAYDAVVKARQE